MPARITFSFQMNMTRSIATSPLFGGSSLHNSRPYNAIGKVMFTHIRSQSQHLLTGSMLQMRPCLTTRMRDGD